MRRYATLRDVIGDEANLNWQGTLFVNRAQWNAQPEKAAFIYLEGDAELEDDIVDEETMLPRLAQENDVEYFLHVEMFKDILTTQRELNAGSTLPEFVRALRYYLEYDTFYWPKK